MEALKHLSSMSCRLNWACGLANLFGKNRNAPIIKVSRQGIKAGEEKIRGLLRIVREETDESINT